jgi:Fe-S-cluster containining protein
LRTWLLALLRTLDDIRFFSRTLRMLEFVGENSDLRADWQRRVVCLRKNPNDDPVEAQNALIDLGPCVFLDEAGSCGVYEARPDACRACHVWHTAEYCGREDYDMCTPAELNALRVDRIHQLMLNELDLGRRPFLGQLLPMVATLDEFQGPYLAGENLANQVDATWIQSELVEFPASGQSLSEVRTFLEKERVRLGTLFRSEENPMGFPRAADARARDFLKAFPLD